MIQWGQPEALWLLLGWGVAAWLVYRLARRRARRLEQLADAAALPLLLPLRHAGRIAGRHALWLAAALLLMVALARPQWGFRWEEVRRRGLDVMVVLDTSNSMLAPDLKPNRLQQAKWGLSDLVRMKLKGDRVGLIAFAGASFLQCPLTIDYAAFLMTLEDVHCGIIPKGGTAITQALRTAMDKLDRRTESDPVIVLITDGEDHEGDPMSLADEFRRRGIRLYAVGVGTPEGELIPREGESGGFLKDRQGQVVKSGLKEDVIARLAVQTGGAYVRASPGEIGIERLYDEGIARLKRSQQESRMAKIFEERFGWFVGAALALLAAEAAVVERRRRPEARTPS